MRFRFTCEKGGEAVSFYSMLTFGVETTVSENTYGDLNLTVEYYLDGSRTASATHSYGDGNAILTLNGVETNLTQGQHTFDVKFTLQGGNIT